MRLTNRKDKFTLSWNTADQIAVDSLHEQLKIVKEQIERIQSLPYPRPEHERLNLLDYQEDRYHLEYVLRYYGASV